MNRSGFRSLRGWSAWTLRAVAAFAGLACGAAPAAADWLVLRDGSRVQTEGKWEVKGRLVVFDRAGGQLSSLRLSDVDLPASEEATAAALAAEAAPKEGDREPVARKARFVFTDADIPRGAGGAETASEAATGDSETTDQRQAASTPGTQSELVVVSWERAESPTGDGVQIYGLMQNQGRNVLTHARLKAVLYDVEGAIVQSGEAELTSRELPPDARTNFVLRFDGVFDFAAVQFEASHRGFEARRTPTDPSGAVTVPATGSE